MNDLGSLDDEQIALIKRTVARGASDDELKLFLHACTRTGLDPLMKQIYAVKRWDANVKRETMAIQTGIDGLRLVAERTGRYAPGREPSYTYLDEEQQILRSATAYIKKMTGDGTWHEVAATARHEEYVQTKQDGTPTRFWQRMPHVMLAKVAEALALRRAFPMELSGIYSTEEMTQADSEEAGKEKFPRLRVEPVPVDPHEPDDDGTQLALEASVPQPDPPVEEEPQARLRPYYATLRAMTVGKKDFDSVNRWIHDCMGRDMSLTSLSDATDDQLETIMGWLKAAQKTRKHVAR